jgi:hypothetical protein
MTTFAGRLTLADGTPVDYAGDAPPRLQVGWCPPNTNSTDLQAQMGKFPGTKFMRLFSSGGLPSWTGSYLNLVPADVTIQLSFKTWPQDVSAWLTSRPANRRTPFYLILDHEPEQQDGGDPTPAQYKQEWQELIAALRGHPRRGEVLLTPTYTEYAATKGSNAARWYPDFGVVSSYEGVDAVGFDIYNTGYNSYRTPEQMFAFALDHARSHELPLVVAEWGIERKGPDASGPNAGTQCAQLMRDQAHYLAGQPEARGLAWFYRGGCNLDTRAPEKQALTDIIGEYQ